jgi:hypothetical protein
MWTLILAAGVAASGPPTIIDMHLNAQSAAQYGPPGVVMCSPITH